MHIYMYTNSCIGEIILRRNERYLRLYSPDGSAAPANTSEYP